MSSDRNKKQVVIKQDAGSDRQEVGSDKLEMGSDRNKMRVDIETRCG